MGFRTVSIPAELYTKIESIVKNRELRYTSVADFVKDAVRDKIKEFATIRTYIDVNADAEVEEVDK